MKHYKLVWAILLGWLVFVFADSSIYKVVSAWAQSPLPICNENTGLAWNMNVEPDMKQYILYHQITPGVAIAGPSVMKEIIPHDPSTTVDNGDGTFSVIHQLTMPEGDRYMAVTAQDVAGSESGLSNEVGCTMDLMPATPTIILKFQSLKTLPLIPLP